MAVRLVRIYSFVLLTAASVLLSCGTHSALTRASRAPASDALPAPKPALSAREELAKLTRKTPAPKRELNEELKQQLSEDLRPVTRASESPIEAGPREGLPESVLGAPETERASLGTKYDTLVHVRAFAAPLDSAWEYRQNPQGKIVGFEFSNRGGNPILPQRYNIDKNWFFSRDFQFRFDDRARQDIHLSVADWAPSRDKQFRLSELMNSVMHFFPRTYVPAIVNSGGRSVVTLPTGEAVEFDARTYEILGGVLSEAPVDLNPDKTARRFAGIQYTGKGLVVRANARGTDPRLGTTATIYASPAADCPGGACKSQCRVPSQELWEQKGAVRFKYASDEEFDRYLLSRCGFGIPKIGSDSQIASAAD